MESFAAAIWTNKWPLVFVYAFMNLQILLFGERLVTAFKRTLEWLRPKMKVHMGLKTALAIANAAALRYRADKLLLFLALSLVHASLFAFSYKRIC